MWIKIIKLRKMGMYIRIKRIELRRITMKNIELMKMKMKRIITVRI